MKLATPKMLMDFTGSDKPDEQCDILRRELGLSPVYRGGMVRISQEALLIGQTNQQKRPKPRLNV